MTRRYIRYVLWFVGIGFVGLIVAKLLDAGWLSIGGWSHNPARG